MGEFSCKGCEKRHPGCHDNCEIYRHQREKLDKDKEQRLRAMTDEFQYWSYRREKNARFSTIKAMRIKTFTSKRK